MEGRGVPSGKGAQRMEVEDSQLGRMSVEKTLDVEPGTSAA